MQTEKKGHRIAVLIPCYNEALTIGNVVRDYRQALPDADIYVYDNNSTDETARLAREAGAIVRPEPRQGKGNVVRTMFRDIEADCYLMVDGDDTYPASQAAALCAPVLEGRADMVIGDRLSSTYFTENKRPFHNSGNMLVRRCINMFWKRGRQIEDVMTGMRAMSPLFVKSFPILSQGFEIETEMTIFSLANNFRIASMPIQYRDRPEGSFSKLNTFRDGFRVLKTIAVLFKDYRPLLVFWSVACLLALLSLGLFLPVLGEYITSGLVPRFPSLIVSGFCMLAALLSFVSGLILDCQRKRARQAFEIQLNMLSFFVGAAALEKARERLQDRALVLAQGLALHDVVPDHDHARGHHLGQHVVQGQLVHQQPHTDLVDAQTGQARPHEDHLPGKAACRLMEDEEHAEVVIDDDGHDEGPGGRPEIVDVQHAGQQEQQAVVHQKGQAAHDAEAEEFRATAGKGHKGSFGIEGCPDLSCSSPGRKPDRQRRDQGTGWPRVSAPQGTQRLGRAPCLKAA